MPVMVGSDIYPFSRVQFRNHSVICPGIVLGKLLQWLTTHSFNLTYTFRECCDDGALNDQLSMWSI